MNPTIQPALDVRPAALATPAKASTRSGQVQTIDLNPFTEQATSPKPASILAGLKSPISDPAALHQALLDLMQLSTEDLSSEQLNELFHTALRMARELPETGIGRGLATLAIAAFAHHLDWRSGGEVFAAAIDPTIVRGFVELADALDASSGSVWSDPVGHHSEQLARGRMSYTGAKNEPLGAMLRLLLGQAESIDRSHRDPGTTRATMRTLFGGLIAGAEQDKADVMAQLQSGDLSEEGLMLLRERLQDANNLISVLNEILTKENEVLEAIIRNFA